MSRPIEVAMTHRVAGGVIERCLRPAPVLETAQRMHRWRGAPETCQNCQCLPAVSIRAGLPLCSRCREQRAIRLAHATGDLRPRIVRAEDEDDGTGPQFRGHMIVFNVKSVDLGGFTEIIRPSAADRMEAEKPDLRALWNHDSAIPIGRISAGTMRARKVTRGVAVEIDPPRWAGDYVESIDRRDVTGMSFAFMALEDDWHLEEGEPVREVLDMETFEGSPVSFPAYPQTDIKVVRAKTRSAWTIERESAERLRLAR